MKWPNANQRRQWGSEMATVLLYFVSGYTIVRCNHHINGVEVDILARKRIQKKYAYTIVEVKFRTYLAEDASAIHPAQLNRLQNAAHYVSQKTGGHVRIDAALWQKRWPYYCGVKNIG